MTKEEKCTWMRQKQKDKNTPKMSRVRHPYRKRKFGYRAESRPNPNATEHMAHTFPIFWYFWQAQCKFARGKVSR
jgi:hypothetical protein